MDPYVKLAKDSIETYIKKGERMAIPKDLPADFYNQTAGVFVSLHQGKELRGCIGTFLPTKKNIAEEIIDNACAACSRDNRFYPVTKEELPKLDYEVSILSEPEPVADISKLDPKKYGVLVMASDGRSGLLLPDLEGVDTIDKQLSIACEKGSLDYELDKPKIYSFTVEKHK